MTSTLIRPTHTGQPGHALSFTVIRSRVLCGVLFAALLLGFVGTASAQGTGTVSGRVSNAATGAYLENAEVRIVGTNLATTTLSGGRFVFTNAPAGNVTIAASYTGLDRMEQQVSVAAGGSVTLNFELTSPQYGEILQLGEFIVSTEREGNAQAIVEQRQAANIKSVIASDAFGSVSEDNVGEFLKYMSGLTIDYVENDARQVRVRGLSAQYASVTIDGNPVASADLNISTGRSFQFEQVSLSTIDTIELNKTPLADQPANSLAGTINVRSKSALNQKGRRIRYNANMTFNEFAMTLGKTTGWDNRERRKALPGGSLEFSDTFMDGRFGVVASLNHTGTYVEQKIIAGIGRSFNADPSDNATEIPRISSVNWQDGLKPTFRDAALINLDFRATPDLILSLRTSYNMYNAPFHNRNWTLAGGAPSATNVVTNMGFGSVSVAPTAQNNTQNTATIAGTNFRKYGATFTVGPAMEWKITPNTTFEGGLSYSRSYQWYDSSNEGYFNIVTARLEGVSWSMDSRPGSTALTISQQPTGAGDTRSFLDISNYRSNTTAQIAERDAKDQTWSGRADVTMRFPHLKRPAVLKFGGDSRLLVKDIETWTRVWTINPNPAAGGINLALYPDPYIPDPRKGQTFIDLHGRVGPMPSLDKWRLYELFSTSGINTDPFTVLTAADQPFFVTPAQAANSLRNRLQNMWDFKEEIQSAYVMGNIRATNDLQIVAGLRFEDTKSQGKAFDDIGHARTVAATGITNTNDFDYILTRYGSRTTKTQSYNDLFPSMQARYTVNENTIVRGAYYRSILRPNPQNIARSLVVNDDETVFQTANPGLKPEYGDNFDLRLEYYFKPVGVISAGLFHKNIKDMQATVTEDFTLTNVPPDIIGQGYNPQDLVANNARITWVENAPETSLWGIELDYSQQLSFLPGAFSGLSVFANYTYTDLKNRELFLGGSGAPKQSANLGVNYRDRRFNGGVKFNWVDDRLLTAPANGAFTYERDRLQIDVNLNYQLHRRATLYLNIANLTGAPSYRYALRPEIITRHGEFGAKYTIGVRGDF
jgi:iron complex outermembrane recepter protein